MNNMKKPHILFLVICVIIVGCKTGNNQDDIEYGCIDTLSVQEPVDSLCPQYVKDITYIRLEDSNKHIISEVAKVEVNKDKFFFYNRLAHRINVYSHSGQFLFEINHRGNGNKEYMEIANYTVDDQYIYIIDNVKNQVVIYSALNGEFKEKRSIPFIAWDMEYLAENEFLFTFLPNNPEGGVAMKQPHGSVWKTDSTFATIQQEYFPYTDKYYEMVGKNYYFTKNDKNVVFHSYQKNAIFLFKEHNDYPQCINVVLPKPTPTGKYISFDDVIKQDYTYLSATPFVIEKYIAFEMGKGAYSETYLMDRKEKSVVTTPEENSHNALLSPSAIIDNKFVAYLSDFDLYEELVLYGFQKADNETETILKEGGACLIVYSMK